MNKFLKKLILAIGLLVGSAFGQNVFPAIVDFPGVPTGGCQPDTFAQNDATGDLYTCASGNWVKVGGSSSPPFNIITPGTNTGALVMGTSGSLSPAGLGQIQATNAWFSASLPGVPALTCISTGGSLIGGHVIYIRYTFTTVLGETTAGPESSINLTSGNCGGSTSTNTVTATAPLFPVGVLSYTVYSSDNTKGAEQKQTAASNCQNLGTGVNCTITVGGTGATVPTTNTAWISAPSGTINSHCAPGTNVNEWTQEPNQNWDEFSSIDTQTVSPPALAGHKTYCYGPIYFNDSGVQPDAGVRNAQLSLFHVPGAPGDGTQSGSGFISPAIGYVVDNVNSPNGSAAMEQHLGIYGEVRLGNNNTTCSPVGGESCVSSIRGNVTDNRTSGTLSASQPLSGVTGVFYKNTSLNSPYSSCAPCAVGVRGTAYNLVASNLGSAQFAGLYGEISDSSGAATNGLGWGLSLHITTRFPTQNAAIYIDNSWNNANDYAIRSDSNNKSHITGDLNIQTMSAGGGGLPLTGGITLLSGLQSNQLATTAPGGASIAPQGGGSANTSYSYRIYGKDPTGAGVPLTGTITTNTGNSTLNGSTFNRVTFNNVSFCSLGITSFAVYRTASAGTPSSTGLIGTFTITDCTAFFGVSQKFDDTGLAGDGNVFPSGNTSGSVTATGFTFGSLNRYAVTSNFTTAANTSLQTITGLAVTTLTIAHNYSFHCALAYSQATGNAVVAFGIQAATIAPTNIFAIGNQQVTVGPPATYVAGTLPTLTNTTATNIVSGTPGATATNYTTTLDGTMELPTGENIINFMVSTATSGDAVTVLRGSYCDLF